MHSATFHLTRSALLAVATISLAAAGFLSAGCNSQQSAAEDGGMDGGGCRPTNGGVEICDHVDNDCDGIVDNGFNLMTDPDNCGDCGVVCSFPRAVPACMTGECRIGACEEGFDDLDGDPANGCEAGCQISLGGIEACDGIDNDCDGEIDEDFDLTSDLEHCGECNHPCEFANAVSICTGGRCQFRHCLPGFTDMDGDAANGCEAQCVITNGGIEACDSLDNDCDGLIDEDFDFTSDADHCGICGNACSFPNAVPGCERGSCIIVACTAGFADLDGDAANGCEAKCTVSNGGVEACDGVDNDCDGEVDEDFGLSTNVDHCGACFNHCETPQATPTCVTGQCYILTCDAGWSDLDGVVPNGCEAPCVLTSGGVEACDGMDNDCDGLEDEDFNLLRDPNNCGTCGNVCELPNVLTHTCIDGVCKIAACDPDTYNINRMAADGCEYACTRQNNGVELCNGIDDDCDGIIDDNVNTEAVSCLNHGVCLGSTPRCDHAVGLVCDYPSTYEPGEESSCDGLDNDCDGVIDETFLVAPFNKGQPCSAGHGPCENSGTFECKADESGTECNVLPLPNFQPEVCDGIDNDCDGIVDNGVDDYVDTGTFFIYRYEASRIDATDTSPGSDPLSRACSQAGAMPWINVTVDEARAACLSAGAHLCTEDEWVEACSGGAANLYPYGNTYEPWRCNGQDCTVQAGSEGPRATGDLAAQDCTGAPAAGSGCATAQGALDMSGNVSEWVDTDKGGGAYGIRGGNYDSLEAALTCAFDNLAPTETRAFFLGFRCCK